MAALLIPLFAALVSISIVNVALPSIESNLGASEADLQWVLSGYMLSFGVFLVPAGRAGDLWGRRKLFLIGIVIFSLASLMAGLATDPLMLNIARILMGLGSGVLNPQIIGIIQQLFSGPARGRAYGTFGTVIGFGVVIGPLSGGLLLQAFGEDLGWRMTFLINVPLGVAAVIFALLWLPAPAPQRPRTSARGVRALDPIGVLLLGASVVLVMIPFIQNGSWVMYALGASGIVLLILWILWERRVERKPTADPMVHLGLFRVASYTLNASVLGLYMAGMPAIWAISAIYVQQGLGYGPMVAGAVTIPSATMVMLLPTPIGNRVNTIGARLLVIGTCISVLGMAAVVGAAALLREDMGDVWLLACALTFVGISQALVITCAQTLSMEEVPEAMAGAASGVAQTAQRVFTAIGVAVVTGAYFAGTAAAGHHVGMMLGAASVGAMFTTSVVTAVIAARRRRVSEASAQA